MTTPSSRPRVAVQPDGKILAAAYALVLPLGSGDFGVQRFRPDGTPDADFGNGGAAVIDIDAPDPEGGRQETCQVSTGLAVQRDGKILVGGTTLGTAETGRAFAMARLLPDGSLDEAFGEGGRVVTEFPSAMQDPNIAPKSWAWASDLALGPGGRIALAGTVRSSLNTLLAVCVYDSSGRLDPAFGEGGRLVLDVPGDDRGVGWVETGGAAFTPGGGLLVTGCVGSRALLRRQIALIRLDSAGRLDPAFGDRGIARAGPGHGGLLVLQPDGKILVGGSADRTREPAPGFGRVDLNREASDFTLARFLPDGTPDPGFGVGGVVRSGLGESDAIEGLALTPGGSILALGLAYGFGDDPRAAQRLTKHFAR